MQVPAIKKLVENYGVQELEKAESVLMEEQEPDIEIEGEDMGEKLTHVIAAVQVSKDMEENGLPFGKAMRNYTEKVRNSIS
jgi:hypothetical protein